jgi:hypothetical protein
MPMTRMTVAVLAAGLLAGVERAAVFALSVVFGAMRLDGCKSLTFQALAHLYAGALYAVWLTTRRQRYLEVALALTILEAVAFFFLKP